MNIEFINGVLRRLFFTFLIVFIINNASTAQSPSAQSFKNIKLRGTDFFTESELIKTLSLSTVSVGSDSYVKVSSKIQSFYQKKGYLFVATYLIEETDKNLTIFIDEGHIGKIIFKGIDDITLIRVKTSLSLDKNVYNKKKFEDELERLKKKFGFNDFIVEIKPTYNYNNNFVQLDQILKFPFMPDSEYIPFYDKFGYQFDILITVVEYTKEEAAKKNKGLKFRCKLNYIGISPKVTYTRPSLLLDNDVSIISLSGGVTYLGDFKPQNPPALGFIETELDYRFPYEKNQSFHPRASAIFRYTHGTRPDIGLESYDYVKDTLKFNPGLSVLTLLEVVPIVGLEKVHMFNVSYASDYNGSKDDLGNILWAMAGFKIEVAKFFGFLRPAIKREASISYLKYFHGDSFQRLDFSAHADFGAFSNDILSFDAKGSNLYGKVPFYHEENVSGEPFYGFASNSYYSRKIIKAGAEYLTSIYRGYLFAGPYAGTALFQATGNYLSGKQTAFCYGGSVHYIFFDQYEFKLYLGKAYLASKNRYGSQITISVEKTM